MRPFESSVATIALVLASIALRTPALAAEIQWHRGESSPPTAISPAAPTEQDTIAFTTGHDGMTYGNACNAAAANGGAATLLINPTNRTIAYYFQPPPPSICPPIFDPVNGLAGNFGTLSAGVWTFGFGTTNFYPLLQFTVYPDPRKLLITHNPSNNTVALSWTISTNNWLLEQAERLPSTGWTEVTNQPATTDNRYVVTLPVASTNQFFRLRQ